MPKNLKRILWFLLAMSVVTVVGALLRNAWIQAVIRADPHQGQARASLNLSSRQSPGQASQTQLAATGSVYFVGNATVIIRIAGFTILTDPNFLHRGDHVHLGYGLQAKRLTNPAIELDALPPIDLIVLSHLHGDHFDPLVEKTLNRSIPIVTTEQAAAVLHQKGFRKTYGLNTWDSMTVHKNGQMLSVSAMPGTHGPGVVSGALPSINGHMLTVISPNKQPLYRMYISGDTLVHDDLKTIPRLYPNIDLALLHLGGTRVLGLMVTMDGRQGVEAMKIIAPEMTIPIHYNDYDRFKSPLSEFQKAVQQAGLANKVHYLKHGQTYQFQLSSRT